MEFAIKESRRPVKGKTYVLRVIKPNYNEKITIEVLMKYFSLEEIANILHKYDVIFYNRVINFIDINKFDVNKKSIGFESMQHICSLENNKKHKIICEKFVFRNKEECEQFFHDIKHILLIEHFNNPLT